MRCFIIQKFKHLLITKFLNITTKRLHDLLHFDKSGTAIKFITVQGIQTVSIHPVQFVQFIQKTNAFRSIIAEHLTDDAGTVHAIFVADIGAGQIISSAR